MERLHRVEELQRDISFQINNRYLLSDVEVLLESTKPSEAEGMERHTGRTRTMKLIHFDAPIDEYAARRPAGRLDHPRRGLEFAGPTGPEELAGTARLVR